MKFSAVLLLGVNVVAAQAACAQEMAVKTSDWVKASLSQMNLQAAPKKQAAAPDDQHGAKTEAVRLRPFVPGRHLPRERDLVAQQARYAEEAVLRGHITQAQPAYVQRQAAAMLVQAPVMAPEDRYTPVRAAGVPPRAKGSTAINGDMSSPSGNPDSGTGQAPFPLNLFFGNNPAATAAQGPVAGATPAQANMSPQAAASTLAAYSKLPSLSAAPKGGGGLHGHSPLPYAGFRSHITTGKRPGPRRQPALSRPDAGQVVAQAPAAGRSAHLPVASHGTAAPARPASSPAKRRRPTTPTLAVASASPFVANKPRVAVYPPYAGYGHVIAF